MQIAKLYFGGVLQAAAVGWPPEAVLVLKGNGWWMQWEVKWWDPEVKQMAAFTARYAGPSNDSESPSPHYWAAELGGVKIFGLSSYTDYEEGSEQYDWFVQALDR